MTARAIFKERKIEWNGFAWIDSRTSELQKEIVVKNARIKQLENAIYMAANESTIDGRVDYCRYCHSYLDEYGHGCKDDCVYLTCIPLPEPETEE
jgi:hypothetical protein